METIVQKSIECKLFLLQGIKYLHRIEKKEQMTNMTDKN